MKNKELEEQEKYREFYVSIIKECINKNEQQKDKGFYQGVAVFIIGAIIGKLLFSFIL